MLSYLLKRHERGGIGVTWLQIAVGRMEDGGGE